jgi:bifunctional non-homologous end joining protein LigD
MPPKQASAPLKTYRAKRSADRTQRRADGVRAELRRLGAPTRAVGVGDVTLMLADTADAPFSGPGWLFELKYDGYRLLAGREGGAPRLLYRHGHEATATFPEIARAVKALPYDGLLLDGEVVVADASGRPVFGELQQRALLRRRADVERAALERPATYYVFDLLAVEGFDVRPLPLFERKRLLRELLPEAGPIRFSDHVEAEGEALYAEVRERGLEGILAKRADSRYRGGRSPHWQKLRAERTADLVVVGFAAPKGSRVGFSGLHLAELVDGTLRYAGRVGSGFSDAELQKTRARLEAIRRDAPACSGPVPKGRENVWVEPRLVCEVRYLERTREGLLRQPVFLRFRDDKGPEVRARPGGAGEPSPPLPPPAPRKPPAAERKVPFSNLDKVFWPEEGFTKGDLLGFYRQASPWLLPYLQDRPVVLTRYPDGVAGKSFFQKDAPSFVPGWVRTERMWSEHAQREIDYFVCDDVESLLYVVNLGSIPLHTWSSRVATLARPDWCILDLDPKGAPFEDVVTLARAIHELCGEIGLPSFPKTSGSTGLHVLVPLGRQCSYEQSRSLGELLARVICEDHGEIATTARAVGSRGGRVYVDYLQNGHGRLLVSPFSVRPLPGAPVSTPLLWKEVRPGLDPKAFTIRTLLPRLRRLKQDPLRPVLEASPDLGAALDQLAARLGPPRGRTS